MFVAVNVMDETTVEQGIANVISKWGAIHVCVNCAGTGLPALTVSRKVTVMCATCSGTLNNSLDCPGFRRASRPKWENSNLSFV